MLLRPADSLKALDWLSWSTLAVGWELSLVSVNDIKEYANTRLAAGLEADAPILELLDATKGTPAEGVGVCLRQLAAKEPIHRDEALARKMWQLAYLEALGDNPSMGELEEAYWSFGQHHEMRWFFPYYQPRGGEPARTPLAALRSLREQLRSDLSGAV